MKICDEQEEQQGWRLEDFKPGDVVRNTSGSRWQVLPKDGVDIDWDVNGEFTGYFPALHLGRRSVICWIHPKNVTARYPNACINLGKPEERP